MKAVIDSNYSKKTLPEYNLVYEKYREVKRSEESSKKVQPITALIISAIEKELKRSKKDQIVLERDYFFQIITNRCDAQIRSYLKQIDHLYEIKVYRDRYSIGRTNIRLFPSVSNDNSKRETNVYNFTQDNWLKIKRSNDDSKTIQAVCLYYISTIEFCFEKNKERNLVIIPSELLHKNNQVGKGQRREQLKQLADLYEIKYHQFLFFEGRRYSEVYTAERQKHCLEILNDPDLFYQKKEKTWVNIDTIQPDYAVEQNKKNCSFVENFNSNFEENRRPLYYKNKEREEVDYNTACYNINAREEILAPEKVAIIPKELPQEIKKPSKTIFLIKDFMPLTQNDCSLLQVKSGREFTLNAMNEILKDLERRRGETANFWHKDAFLAYFAKVLKQEKRDAVKTSSESFRIKSNLNEEEISERAIEKYLTEIEYSLEVSPEWHFKKKICSVLEPKSAYNFLKNYHKSEIEGTTFKIYLRNEIALRESEKNIILNQARASHEKVNIGCFEVTAISDIQFIFYNKSPQHQQTKIAKTMEPLKEDKKMLLDQKVARELKHVAPFCEFIEKGENKIAVRILEGIAFEDSTTERVKTCIKSIYGEDVTITRLRGAMNNENTASFRAVNDNIMDDSLLKQNIIVKSGLKQEFKGPEKKPDTKPQTPSRNNLNERFKTVLASQFYTNGAATVRNWFERLAYDKTRSEEDKLVLVGECFVVDWIKNNYSFPLEKTARKMNISLEICYHGHGTPEMLIKKIENNEK